MDGAVSGASRLPQLHGRPMVTDGGMETDLIFHHGIDLPHFAAFPLLESARGQALLADYYDGYAAIARRAGAGLVLESPTWRANPDWGAAQGIRRLLFFVLPIGFVAGLTFDAVYGRLRHADVSQATAFEKLDNL